MNALTLLKSGRFFLSILAFVVTLGVIFAPAVGARVNHSMSNGGEVGGPGQATEGDPLDANDFDTGSGSTGDDIHESASVGIVRDFAPRTIPVIKASFFCGAYLIGLDYMGSLPVLHFINISDMAATAEGTDAR